MIMLARHLRNGASLRRDNLDAREMMMENQRLTTALRELNADEIEMVAGGGFEDENGNGSWDEGEIITVMANLSGSGSSTGGGSGLRDPVYLSSQYDPIEPEETPPCPCANMTEAMRQEVAIDAEVAEILREILEKAAQNMEYGSLIWIDSAGVVQHTPLTAASGYLAAFNLSVLPTNPDGLPDYSSVVAIVHSHPQLLPDTVTGQPVNYFSTISPDRLLYPSQTHTRDGVVQGDWITFDYYAGRITASGGNTSQLQQYIIGWDGDKFVINQYDSSDRETGTSATGDAVDPNTEACKC